jgi:hypothetical protein
MLNSEQQKISFINIVNVNTTSMKRKELFGYGTIVEIPVHPVVSIMGIKFSCSSDEKERVLFAVEKYREEDTNPMEYKVCCVPIDQSGKFGKESFYSSDLRSLIREGVVKVVNFKS